MDLLKEITGRSPLFFKENGIFFSFVNFFALYNSVFFPSGFFFSMIFIFNVFLMDLLKDYRMKSPYLKENAPLHGKRVLSLIYIKKKELWKSRFYLSFYSLYSFLVKWQINVETCIFLFIRNQAY